MTTNMNKGLGAFKENAQNLLGAAPNIISHNQDILNENTRNKLNTFLQNFETLSGVCDIVKRIGTARKTINNSAFYLNYEGSGYKNFIALHPEGAESVLQLSESVQDFLGVINNIKDLDDPSKASSKDVRSKEISDILSRIEKLLPKAENSLSEIVKILWPEVTLTQEGKILIELLTTNKGKHKESALLKVIQNLDLGDLNITDLQSDLIKTKKDAKEEIDSLKEEVGEESSNILLTGYQEVCDKIKGEISWLSEISNSTNQTDDKNHTDDEISPLRKSFNFTKKVVVEFLGLLRRLFNLQVKILLLRVITYTIPIFLLIFHFGEFFEQRNKDKNAVILVNNDDKSTASLKISITSTDREKLNLSLDNPNKKIQDNNSYLYFHLALITILALAFQQLRIAIKELSIKKSLYEIYRHRALVSENFIKMYKITEGDAKNEVIKSATRSLFENEPSIYENRSTTLPPHVVDIKNITRG
jgi:hypothetical protein